MLSEMTCSDFDEWFDAVTNRPWYLDPQRYYGNYQLSLIFNAHSKHPASPETFDIYYREKPIKPKSWQSIKAAMAGISGVTRKDKS